MLHKHPGTVRVFVFTLGSALGLALLGATALPLATLSFTLAKHQLAPGTGTSGTAVVSPTSAAVQVMNFSSSNTAVAHVPAGMPIGPGGSRATVPVIAVAPGCVEIRAKSGTQSRVEYLVVNPVPATGTFAMMTPDGPIYGPGSNTGKITANPRTTTRVSLVSSNPSVIAVPATVETVGGVASFRITAGWSPGCVKITATAGSQSVSKYVQAVIAPG